MTDPDDKDSLIGGDALSNTEEDGFILSANESLIDDSPLNEGEEEAGAGAESIPPPAD